VEGRPPLLIPPPPGPVLRAARGLARGLVRLGFRVTLDGLENLPAGRAYVLAGNHVSLLDGPLIALLAPQPTVLMVAAEWARNPLARPLLRLSDGVIGVRRGEQDEQAVAEGLALLRSGRRVVLAPEGRVTRSGGLQRGRPGVVRLASAAGVPVVPLGWYGQARPQDRWLRLRRAELHLRFGAPLHLDPDRPEEESLETVMRAIASLLPAPLRGVYAS